MFKKIKQKEKFLLVLTGIELITLRSYDHDLSYAATRHPGKELVKIGLE